jgi:hypothetical protein
LWRLERVHLSRTLCDCREHHSIQERLPE